MKHRPPRLIRWVAARVLPVRRSSEILSDLDEVFDRVTRRAGVFRATFRYMRELGSLARWHLVSSGRPHKSSQLQMRKRPMLEQFVSDVRFALRSFIRRPAFAALAIATLSIGLGGVVTMFSVVNGILLKPLDFERPEELVVLKTLRSHTSFESLSQPDLIDIREQNETLRDVALWRQSSAVLVGGDGRPREVNVGLVSSNYFELVGTTSAAGRAFTESDEIHRVVVLSNSLWQSAFGGDNSLIGNSVSIDGHPVTVLGASNDRFEDPVPQVMGRGAQPDLWMLQPWTSNNNRSWRGFWGVARARSGVSVAEVSADLHRIALAHQSDFPETNTDHDWTAVSLHERIAAPMRSVLWTLFAAVSLLMLIACANVANLLLTRAVGRVQEMSVRNALGAGRGRILRQLLTESLVLAGTGGAMGLFVAYVGVSALVQVVGERIPRAAEIGLDSGVLLFALAAAVGTSVLFGLAPAWRLLKPAVAARDSGKGSAGLSVNRLRSSLVVAEIALAVILMVGAGLLLKSFSLVNSIDVGFDRSSVLTFRPTPPAADYPAPESLTHFYRQMFAALEERPEIQSAGGASDIPLSANSNSVTVYRSDRPQPASGEGVSALTRAATANFFRSIGSEFQLGRSFVEADDSTAPNVMIINEATARTFYPDENPIGKSMFLMGVERQIIGVVGDTKQGGPTEGPRITVFIPYAQTVQSWLHRRALSVVVRTASQPDALANIVRETVWSVNSGVPMRDFKTTEMLFEERIWEESFRTWLMGAFAAIATLLTTVGVAGVISYSVSERRREIGIRKALGAPSRRVVSSIMKRTLSMTGLGLVIGLGFAFAVSGVIENMLFGVSARDVRVFAVVPFLVAIVAGCAAFFPVRTASLIDPATTLREDG